MGRATDTTRTALGGVSVSVSDQTATTDEQGWFTLSDVPVSDRALVTFSKTGYVDTQRVIEVIDDEISPLDAVLSQTGTVQSLDASAGGTVSHNGGSVEIGANSLVDPTGSPFTGTAQASLTSFDPTVESQREAFPGNFAGLVDGTEKPFESYGFMDVSVTGSGELQLAPGETSTVEIPIPTAQVDTAPETIPLWYYDTSDGYWKQEGTATKVGNVYRGTITHFSTWNADYLYEQAYLTGTVKTQVVPYSKQTKNWNCGPTSLAMGLKHWGIQVEIDAIARVTNNYNPETQTHEIFDWEAARGYAEEKVGEARFYPYRDFEDAVRSVKEEIDKGHPVLLRTGLTGAGHVIVIVDYSDDAFIAYDPRGRFDLEEGYPEWNKFSECNESPRESGRGVTYELSWFKDKWKREYEGEDTYGRMRIGRADERPPGSPVASARVMSNGADYSGMSSTITGADGRFRIPVRPNSSVEIQARKGGGMSSTASTVTTPTSEGGEIDMGDIVLNVPPEVGEATSLEFKVDLTYMGETSMMSYMIKNIETSNLKLRVGGTTYGQDFIYIIDVGEEKAYAYAAGTWIDMSAMMQEYFQLYGEAFSVYQTELAEWAGGDYTYEFDGTTIRIYGIQVNLHLPDSLFQPG